MVAARLILAPRKTKILATRPVLRWTAVAGVSSYKISVRGPNLNWTTDVAGTTELIYPGSAPALALGSVYKLSVAAGARSSDEDGAPGLGFTLLKAEEAQNVRSAEARIRALGLDDVATRFLVANLYASHELYAEAIADLAALAIASSQPAIVRMLGDLYLSVGLNRLAEERFLQALALSEKANDSEGIAAAENALGLVYESLGAKAEAIRHTEKAITWYQKLGDAKTSKAIQDRLSTLQK